MSDYPNWGFGEIEGGEGRATFIFRLLIIDYLKCLYLRLFKIAIPFYFAYIFIRENINVSQY